MIWSTTASSSGLHAVQQEQPGVAVPEAADRQGGQPGQQAAFRTRPLRAHQRHPLGQEAAGNEPDDLRGRLVEPQRVVDDAGQRALLGRLRHQRQRGESDQEAVGGRAGAQPEHGREGGLLRGRQLGEAAEQRCAQLMQAAVGQFHLRLHARSRHDLPAFSPARRTGHPIAQVIQQGALACARVAAQDEDAAHAREHVGREPVERFAFVTTSDQFGHRSTPKFLVSSQF
jgi:hypothetical protein